MIKNQAYNYLLKPIDIDNLKVIVTRMLRSISTTVKNIL